MQCNSQQKRAMQMNQHNLVMVELKHGLSLSSAFLNISNVNVPMDATCASTILSGCIQVNFWQRLTKLSAKEI